MIDCHPAFLQDIKLGSFSQREVFSRLITWAKLQGIAISYGFVKLVIDKRLMAMVRHHCLQLGMEYFAWDWPSGGIYKASTINQHATATMTNQKGPMRSLVSEGGCGNLLSFGHIWRIKIIFNLKMGESEDIYYHIRYARKSNQHDVNKGWFY